LNEKVLLEDLLKSVPAKSILSIKSRVM